jgi:hypothetical protein
VIQQSLTCPGYNDANRHRVDITDRVRGEANAELIITKPERPEEDRALRNLIRSSVHANGTDNTIIVMTRCSVSVVLLSFAMLVASPFHADNDTYRTSIQQKLWGRDLTEIQRASGSYS